MVFSIKLLICVLASMLIHILCEPRQSKFTQACLKWAEDSLLTTTMGQKIDELEFLSTAALFVLNKSMFTPVKFACTAVLISHKKLITSGHCVSDPIEKIPLFIRFTKDYTDEKDFKDYYVKNFTLHPRYNNGIDLAILELEDVVEFTPKIRPACLLGADLNYDYSQFEIAFAGFGVGYFHEDGIKSEGVENKEYAFINGPLRKISMKKVADASISKDIQGVYDVFTWANSNLEGMVCAGDSGGAVQVEYFGGLNMVLGIAKAGNTKELCSMQTAFINVTKEQKWIESIAFNDF